MQALFKPDMMMTYLSNDSSVVAVTGQHIQGGNIAIWDPQRPLLPSPIACLSYPLDAVTAMM